MTDTQHLSAEFEELVYQAQIAEDSEKCDYYTREIEKKRQGESKKVKHIKHE